ncbi:MAG: LamG domain-containing protein, partial [Salibacteraceae bacterium]
MYYPFDGNAGDSSTNSYHGVVNGGVSTTTNRFGDTSSAYEFDGINDWINSQTTFDYNYRSVSCWLTTETLSGGGIVLVNDAQTMNYGSFFIALHNSGYFNATAAGTSPASITIINNPQINTWYHVVIVRDGATNNYYVNGQYVGQSNSNNNGSTTNPNLNMLIGVHRNMTTRFHKGKVDEVRVYNRVLSPVEVMALYCPTAPNININDTTIDINSTITFSNDAYEIDTMAWYINGTYMNSDSSFVHLFDSAGVYEVVAYGSDGFCGEYDTIQVMVDPPNCLIPNALQDGLRLHYVMSGNANDLSPSEYDAFVYGATPTSDRFGSTGRAYQFDGTNDYIEYENPDTNLDYQERTVSLWFYADAVSGSSRVFNMDHNAFTYGSIGLSVINSQLRGNGGGDGGAVLQNPISTGQWYHAVVQRDATNTYGYVNGQLVYTGTASNAGSSSLANFNFIVGCSRAYNEFFDGKIDDIRVFDRVLDAEEVKTLYCPALAKITENDTLIESGEQLTFHSECNVYNTSWSVNGLTVSNDSIYSHSFMNEGIDTVVLASTDGFCTNYDTVFIVVEPLNCLTSGSTIDSLLLYIPMSGSPFNAGTLQTNITLSGATSTIDRFGNVNSAYNFDGNDHIEVEHNFDYNHKTFSFWFRATNTSGSGNSAKFIFAHDDNNNTYGSSGAWYNNGELYLKASSGGAEVISNDAPINTWNHITLIRDNLITRYYLNGNHVLTGTGFGGGSASNANPNLVIGAGRSTINQFFQGQIDEARVYNRALSPEEVKTLYCPSQAIIQESDTIIYSGITRTFNAGCTEYPLSWV